MDKHFTVTIHDDSGVKQYNIHKLMKKVFFYGAILLVSFIVLAVGTIYYLNKSVEAAELRKEKIQKESEAIQVEMQNLLDTKLKELEVKQDELSELAESLTEIEEMIGIRAVPETPLQKRIDLAALTSSQRLLMLQLIPSGIPVDYYWISSNFGYRTHPIKGTRDFHPGIDLGVKMNAPVYATADGVAEWAAFHKKSGYGKLVILDHSYGFKSYYGHLNKITIKSGQVVKKGDLIGYSGNTGLSSGPHLHYELHFLYRSVNPYYYMQWTQQNFDQLFKKEKRLPWNSIIDSVAGMIKQTNKESKENNDTTI